MLAGTVVETDENRVERRAAGEPAIEQQRHFVRGGGGEQVAAAPARRADATGWIRDISEHGVRAHFAGVDVRDGDELPLRIQLGHDVVEVTGTATRGRAAAASRCRPGPMSVEVVAIFDADEAQAQIIRRYVLRQRAR